MLTDLQKRFCEIYIQHGGKNATECVRLAGYSDSSDAASVRAHELLRNENVLAELRRLAQCRISAAVAVAAAELETVDLPVPILFHEVHATVILDRNDDHEIRLLDDAINSS